MRIESILFGDLVAYRRMADVFRHTARINSPASELNFKIIDSSDKKLLQLANDFTCGHDAWMDNARKTKHHCDIVQNANDGEELCLIDSDTMILRELSTAFGKDFDICLTHRRGLSQYPINSGVVFVRVSQRTKEFYHQWYENVKRLMQNEVLMQRWHRSHGGINQAALGLLLKEGHSSKVQYVPCSMWNCTSDVHHTFDPGTTRVVHINGSLRRYLVYGGTSISEKGLKMAEIWRQYESESKRRSA